ncbi:MAG TPA: VWA domain-containing protein [Burkholderiales bacterium]
MKLFRFAACFLAAWLPLLVAGCLPPGEKPTAPSSPPSASPASRPAAKQPESGGFTRQELAGAESGRAKLVFEVHSLADLRQPAEPLDREVYGHHDDNPVKRVAEHPVSTFGVDVDTGAYANVRRMLLAGRLPPRDAVRVEEMINYFDYAYPRPEGTGAPFRVQTEIAPAPWNPRTHLLRIGIQGEDISRDRLPPANLVFLVDVSGSMMPPEKLPLLKSALKLLTQRLRPEDRVSLAVYAGASGVVLEPTPGDRHGAILAAIEQLQAGGSTNGGAGIRLAYALAEKAFIPEGINRVILATDGDFNVGTVSFEALKDLVAEKRKGGVSLTTLGFGTGNYNDRLMESLADVGNGNYHYIDTLNEARKVLDEEMASTLYVIARDVKLQIEFNPRVVAEYRLIGYENRVLQREDFANDQVDSGDIGAGHRVTALYEIALQGSGGERIEPLRYGADKPQSAKGADELAFLRIRYKRPAEEQSRLLERPIRSSAMNPDLASASPAFRFAAAVAGFGQMLRGGQHTGPLTFPEVERLARGAGQPDPYGYRAEFVKLVRLAQALSTQEKLSAGPEAAPVR